MNISHYAKAITQIVAAVLVVLVAALTDGRVSPAEFVNIVLALAAAVLVFWVPNLASGPAKYWKAIIGWISAAGSALVLVLAPGVGFGAVSLSDWLTVVLAGLGAIGIGIIPNGPKLLTATNSYTLLTGPASADLSTPTGGAPLIGK